MLIKLRYSTLSNYRHCPFRLLLLEFLEKQPLFPAQYIGLFAHEWLERYLRQEINGEDVLLSAEDVHQTVITNRLVDEDVSLEMGERLPLYEWGNAIVVWLKSKGVFAVETEKEMSRVYNGRTIYGTADLIAETDTELFIVDFKRSNFPEHYYSDQMLLYSWLMGEKTPKPVKEVFFVFLNMDGGITIKGYSIEKRKRKIDQMLRELYRLADVFENELWEYLPPNPFQRSCHPKRCAVYHMCPYAGGKAVQYEG